MGIFDGRPGLRWAVPAGAATIFIAGAGLAPLVATADSGLAPRTAKELLVALQEPTSTAVSGTVVTKADLGLPDLPMGMQASSGALALASGESTLRVWTDGPERQRVAVIEQAAETTIIRNGREAWVWSSSDATADHYALPEHDGGAGGEPTPSELPPGAELPSTPQEAAAMALEAIDPTTEVTTSGVARVAGRDAYELVLTPRDPATLVARVTLELDAETSVPLRVRVYSTTMPDPALEVGFSSVDFATPDAGLFEFTPPPGAAVTDHPASGDRAVGSGSRAATGAEPTVVGPGWSTVLIVDLPAGALSDLAEAGTAGQPDGSGSGRDMDPAATALTLIQALPAESGAWGTGRVFRGTLFSVILTDDGRVAVGAVAPETLGAALAAQ